VSARVITSLKVRILV
jgi:hypothetical protein